MTLAPVPYAITAALESRNLMGRPNVAGRGRGILRGRGRRA